MPELPEVQTTVNCLQLTINKKIVKTRLYTKKLRYFIPKEIIKFSLNKKILNIYRVAKYIIIQLNSNFSIIIHLGMSGRVKLLKANIYNRVKHDHVFIYLNNNYIIVLNDPRRFGFIDLIKSSELKTSKYFIKLGPDPFDQSLNKHYLRNKFKNSRSSIKQLLLNQKIISGIGNIYASEILFDAKISPFILGKYLKEAKLDELIISIRRILKKAIVSGGTTLKNYASADGTLGNFQNQFKVYNRNNKKVNKFTIKRVKQNGRSTFYCPRIQKSAFNPINEE